MKLAAEVAVWFVALAGLFCVWISSVTIAEAVLAVVAALLCAGVAVAGRQAEFGSYRPRGLPRGAALRLPWDVLTDTARLAGHLWLVLTGRRPRSGYLAVRLVGMRPARSAAARRAYLTLSTSTAPGSYVAQLRPGDHGRDLLLIHRIDPTTSDVPDPAVAARLSRRGGRG